MADTFMTTNSANTLFQAYAGVCFSTTYLFWSLETLDLNLIIRI